MVAELRPCGEELSERHIARSFPVLTGRVKHLPRLSKVPVLRSSLASRQQLLSQGEYEVFHVFRHTVIYPVIFQG